MRYLLLLMLLILLVGCMGSDYCGDGLCQAEERGVCDDDCSAIVDVRLDDITFSPDPGRFTSSLNDFKVVPKMKVRGFENGRSFYYKVLVKDSEHKIVDACEKKAYFYRTGFEMSFCIVPGLDPGKYEVSVLLDSRNETSESDKLNNIMSRNITVSGSPFIEHDISYFRFADDKADEMCMIVTEGRCVFYTADYENINKDVHILVGVEVHEDILTNQGLKSALEDELSDDPDVEVDGTFINGNFIFHIHDDYESLYLWRTKTAVILFAFDHDETDENIPGLFLDAYLEKYPSILHELDLALCNDEGDRFARKCCDGLDPVSVNTGYATETLCAYKNKGGLECINGTDGEGIYYAGTGEFLKTTSCNHCTDSDGLDYYTRGRTKSGKGTYYDGCLDNKTLVEYTCKGHDIIPRIHACEDVCRDGVCMIEDRCSDTDAGIDYYVRGQVTAVKDNVAAESDDYCIGDNIVEFYCCSDGSACSVSEPCPEGCHDGSCISGVS